METQIVFEVKYPHYFKQRVLTNLSDCLISFFASFVFLYFFIKYFDYHNVIISFFAALSLIVAIILFLLSFFIPFKPGKNRKFKDKIYVSFYKLDEDFTVKINATSKKGNPFYLSGLVNYVNVTKYYYKVGLSSKESIEIPTSQLTLEQKKVLYDVREYVTKKRELEKRTKNINSNKNKDKD